MLTNFLKIFLCKTSIIINLAADNIILGHKGNIVTSSELAKRDSDDEKTKKFMNI